MPETAACSQGSYGRQLCEFPLDGSEKARVCVARQRLPLLPAELTEGEATSAGFGLGAPAGWQGRLSKTDALAVKSLGPFSEY